MKTVLGIFAIVLALAAASPALARVQHHYRPTPAPAPYNHVDSGWGPPSNWSEIEISHPDGGF